MYAGIILKKGQHLQQKRTLLALFLKLILEHVFTKVNRGSQFGGSRGI